MGITREQFIAGAQQTLDAFIEMKKRLASFTNEESENVLFEMLNPLQERAAQAFGPIDHLLSKFGNRMMDLGDGDIFDIYHESLTVYNKKGSVILYNAIAGLRLAISKAQNSPDIFDEDKSFEIMQAKIATLETEFSMANEVIRKLKLELAEAIRNNRPYMVKEDNNFYSPRLEAAVSAWMALFHEGKYNPRAGVKQQVLDWISTNRAEVGGRDDLIARIVNPELNKSGGCPSPIKKFSKKKSQKKSS